MYLTWKQWLLLNCGFLFAFGAWAQPGCEQYELQSHKRGSQITDRQPELKWGGDANASYRVQVAVVLPEGRVLESVDTVVTGTRWRLGAPVSVVTAVVKVLVSRNCPSFSVQDLNAQGPYLIIQSADQCAIGPQSVQQQADVLRWDMPQHSHQFLVQFFSMAQVAEGGVATQRIGGYEVTGASWSFPADLKAKLVQGSAAGRAWVATVQARCGALLGPPRAVVVRFTS